MKKKFPKNTQKDPQFKKCIPLLNYWKRCTELQLYFQKENDVSNAEQIEISRESFLSGKLSQDEQKKLMGVSSIILSPLNFKKRHRSQSLEILKIPLLIENDGKLSPNNSLLPWIPRILLEPQIETDALTVANLDDFETFYKKHSEARKLNYQGYIKFCKKLLLDVCGLSFETPNIDDYVNSEIVFVHPYSIEPFASDSVLKLANAMMKGNRSLGAFPTYLNLNFNKINYKFTKKFISQNSKLHVGHFNPTFALSTSQRSTIYKLLDEKDCKIFPIDGPPGTGKTTVIQSIIANNFVSSILNGKKSPPVIVICGATNQSVINVIDCLDSSEISHPFTERWIPNIRSYGLFCVSQNKADNSPGYNLQKRDGSGFFLDLINETDSKELENYYLTKFSSNLEKVTSIHQAKKVLRKRLLSLQKELNSEIQSTLNYSWIEKIFGGFFSQTLFEYEQKINKFSEFDTKIRYLSFIMATHYWEAEWISLINNFKSSISQDIGFVHLSKIIWKWKSMLTPAFVSTIAMAPRFFQDHKSPIIDLLIMDEAGQITPDQGGIISTLSNQIITIGDTKQLKPYSLIPTELDRIEIGTQKLSKNLRIKDDKIAETGLTSSQGSIMQLSLSCFPKSDAYGPGGSLNEHRRSVPQIVEFCNELSYHGRLIPKRPKIERPLYPAFSLVSSSGNSSKVGSSRINLSEAKLILSWLEENSEKVKAYYKNTNLHEIVAILTPFTAQAKTIKNQVESKFRGLTIGTVNSLQGAERAIILFSPVYDETDKSKYMLDRNPTLLNVAVSRAKDSFIVVGNIKVLLGMGSTPSNILAKYLKSSV